MKASNAVDDYGFELYVFGIGNCGNEWYRRELVVYGKGKVKLYSTVWEKENLKVKL